MREKSDLIGLSYGLELLADKKDLIALDIGCAEGFVTNERFSKYNNFSHVVGIDRSIESTEKANASGYENCSFYQVDIETQDGIFSLKNILKEQGRDGFDVIFTSAVFHHLKNPTEVLKRIRKFMNENSVIVVVSYDDKLIVSYPDPNNLVDNFFKITKNIPDIFNREHGRQLLNELSIFRFKNTKIFLDMISIDNMSIDGRLELFESNFLWSTNYIKRAIEKYPEQEKSTRKRLKMD